MLTRQVLIRCCVLAVLIAPIAACTSILGVEDRELNCLVPPEYSAQMLAGTNITLTKTGTTMMTPRLIVTLDPSTVLLVELYDRFGMHDIVNAPGTYQITLGDATPRCGICVNAQVYNGETGKYEIKYIVSEGTLELTRADTTGLTGKLTNVTLQRANKEPDGTSFKFVPLNNGCELSVPSVTFDKNYM